MRCEHCQGVGLVAGLEWAHVIDSLFREQVWWPCHECKGSGIVSCCEGSEQGGQLPEVEKKEDE
ncbi:hypothetical protein CMI37_09065 [Candidatus Pacearchaeota archaeon]|nr:hypothetical protein [Candidatus Pacearchaeota archaeon]